MNASEYVTVREVRQRLPLTVEAARALFRRHGAVQIGRALMLPRVKLEQVLAQGERPTHPGDRE